MCRNEGKISTAPMTWLFDEGIFSLASKIVGGEMFSIVCDYLGKPEQMYDADGYLVWNVEYDIYGQIRKLAVGSLNDCPFRYPGQYFDCETGLYYNRFRYYDPGSGGYLSQDPIGLAGRANTLFGYVTDVNFLIDPCGLVALDSGGHYVYGLYEPGATSPYYVGITNDPAIREMQHLESGRLGNGNMQILESDLTYAQARGHEQALIEHHGTKTGIIGEEISSTNKGNKINSFDKTRIDDRGMAFKAEYEKAKANLDGKPKVPCC
jgi:RHS repeat-associated protein